MSAISSRLVLRVVVLVAATVPLLVTSPVGLRLAAAQPASDKAAQADAAFTEGKELMKAGKLAEACSSFDRSQRIDPKVTTLVNLANCREKNGQLATAARAFSDAAEQLRAGTDQASVALRTLAAERVAALQPRLSRLTVRLAANAPDGFELLRGSVAIPAAQWGQPIPLDGGTYQLSARAPGHKPWSATISVRPEGDNITLDVPALTPAASAPLDPSNRPDPSAARSGDTPSPVFVDDGKPQAVPRRRSLALPIGLGAGALVLGGLAIGLDVHARGLQDEAIDLNEEENAQPPGAERMRLGALSDDKHESAKSYRYLAQGVGIAALGCAGAAVYLLVRGGGSSDDAKSSPTASRALSPVFAPGLAGMQLSGSW
jgi:tetratricopeptide (TPR) repeat protein